MFTSVRAPRVYEPIVDQVERAIFDGRLDNGDRLPTEREMVRQFRASRVAVREALRTLEHRGLIEVRHGSSGGHFVRHADAGLLRRDFATLLRLARVSLAQLTEARLLIEPEVARLAAERATEADVEAIRAALGARAMLAGAPPRALDMAFHRLVAAAVRNPVHAVLVDALMDLEAEVVAPQIDFGEEDNTAVAGAHGAIFAAVAAHDPLGARTAMESHVMDLQRRLGRMEAARHPG